MEELKKNVQQIYLITLNLLLFIKLDVNLIIGIISI